MQQEAAMQYPVKVSVAVSNAAITTVIGSFIGPYIISLLLKQIQSGKLESLHQNSWLILGYIATQLYGEIIGWRINLYMIWQFETAGQKNLHEQIFSKLTNQTVAFHANRFGGSLVSQTNKFVGSFERFWDTIVFSMMPALSSVIAATAILSFVFWQYAVALFVISLIFIAIIFAGSRKMAILNTQEAQASTRQTGQLADAMTNILAIKSHGHEDHESKLYKHLAHTWRERSLDTMRGFLVASTGYSSMIAVLNTSALVMALWASAHNIIAISTVYLSVTYTFTVARQLWEMNNIMRNYNRIMGDAHDMTVMLGLENEIQDMPNAPELAPRRGKIEFKNVTFSHDGDTQNALFSGLNLRIKPGEKIGLVGQSGSGKTTLTKLLLRFMDVQSGTILVDDQDITKVTQSSLRKAIAYVPQEPLLFHRSLADNIEYGELGSDKATIEGVSKMAHAHEFIQKLEHGYDTLVGERGVKLSGGQRQRVAIARAMIKNARILVLDEATSALDSESEALIQDALWTLMEGRTAIVIAHRLSTIQKMDRIIVMEDGKITEQGSHKELIHKNGNYAELWKRQSGGFLDD